MTSKKTFQSNALHLLALEKINKFRDSLRHGELSRTLEYDKCIDEAFRLGRLDAAIQQSRSAVEGTKIYADAEKAASMLIVLLDAKASAYGVTLNG